MSSGGVFVCASALAGAANRMRIAVTARMTCSAFPPSQQS
jgi:hypothetical protein